jgi:hypothetical protein
LGGNVKLINLSTGEVREVDSYKLAEMGMPDGFEMAENLTTDDWIYALQEALSDR